MLNGNNIRLRLGANQDTVVNEVSHTFDLNYSVIPITREDTGAHAQYISNISSASITFEGLMSYGAEQLPTDEMFDDALIGTEIQLASGTDETSAICRGIITSFNQTGASDEVATVSMTIQITGTIERSVIQTIRDLCINGETICIFGQSLQVSTALQEPVELLTVELCIEGETLCIEAESVQVLIEDEE